MCPLALFPREPPSGRTTLHMYHLACLPQSSSQQLSPWQERVGMRLSTMVDKAQGFPKGFQRRHTRCQMMDTISFVDTLLLGWVSTY